MSEDKESPLSKKINTLGESKWVVFGIPLLAVIGVSFTNLRAGITLLFSFLVVWVAVGVISKVLKFTDRLYPENTSATSKEEFQGSIGFTLFAGFFAIAGIVLQGDNFVSGFVTEHTAGKMSFINPSFALVAVVGVWTYTLYKNTKQSAKTNDRFARLANLETC